MCFLSAVLVFTLIFILVYFSLKNYNKHQADGMTQIISTYNGTVPQMQEYNEMPPGDSYDFIIFNEESAFKTRYFIVCLDNNMEPEETDLEHVASVDEDTAYEMAETAVASGKTTGYIGEYRYRITTDKDGKDIVILLDCPAKALPCSVLLH